MSYVTRLEDVMIGLKRIALMGLLMVGLGCETFASAQEVTLPPPMPTPASSTIPTGEDGALRMTVPVMINGAGPFQFIVDTGSDHTVLSTEIADQLNLPSAGRARIQAMNGPASGKLVRVDKFDVSTNTMTNRKLPAIPRARLGADGLVGIDALDNLRITIEFDEKRMFVEPATAPPKPKPSNVEEIVVEARSRLGQMVMIDADSGGGKVWAVVDTGAQTTIGNTALRRFLVKGQRVKQLYPITITDVMGQSATADYAIIERIRLGGLKIGGAAVAFIDANPFRVFKLQRRPALLLGMETLRGFKRVTIDFARRRVTFLLPR
jgi:predicted aspartyl protease